MDSSNLSADAQQQADNDALASAVAAAAAAGHDLSLGGQYDPSEHQPHFHHTLQQPDFSQTSHHMHKDDHQHQMDVHSLDIASIADNHAHGHGQQSPELDLGFGSVMGDMGDMTDMGDMGELGDMDMDTPRSGYGRPPSIRKACDLCHDAKQKCSGDRPSCVRCTSGGWTCNYAPRQRRRMVPKGQKHAHSDMDPSQPNSTPAVRTHHKKRKVAPRESIGTFGSEALDMKMAMGMAMDMGLTGEEEGEEMQTMTDEQMLESIHIDGYLADLPLATFVHNLPFTVGGPEDSVHFSQGEFPSAADAVFPTADMDQHTTSALRDAIFSLNESGGAGGHVEGTGEGDHVGGDGNEVMDPHLALLDLSNMANDNDPNDGQGAGGDPTAGLHLPDFTQTPMCHHRQLVPHILSLLTQHALEQKPGTNTPLTLAVFAPLARSLRLFHSLAHCPSCGNSPQQTLPQLALLSRTTTLLTFPHPPCGSSTVGSSAQITIHGARLSGTGLSEAIEQHIVGVVWDSWRASIREVFAVLDKKARDIITGAIAANASSSTHQSNEQDPSVPPPPPQQQHNQQQQTSTSENNNNNNNNDHGIEHGDANEEEVASQSPEAQQPTIPPQPVSSLEKQRAGLVFQAVSRLVTAMDEVESG